MATPWNSPLARITSGHLPSLDGIRAVALLVVLSTHATIPLASPGYFGVDMFFALSGFLITSLLLAERARTGGIDLPGFVARRTIRLVPALVVTVVIAGPALALVFAAPVRVLVESASALLYLTPVTDRLIGPSLGYGQMWTLTMEQLFYLLWPLLFIVALRCRHGTRFLVGALAVATTGLYAIYLGVAFTGHTPPAMCRVAGIALGCLLAFALRAGITVSLPGAGIAGTVGTLLAWVLTPTPGESFVPMIAAASTCGLIVSLLGSPEGPLARLLGSRPLAALGTVSYEMYLWHLPMIVLFAAASGRERIDVWWMAYPLTLALAVGTHRFLMPFQRKLRHRFSVGRSAH
ncbi:acyltransferase family protein [Microbacterium testaceum]|uniref:acyltransferase family protein n=1 Tax=Microbacterium testaceum TaxID=2033 RepID=UPI000B1BFCB9|nr:acyltransferase [Microbacterium testaceum]